MGRIKASGRRISWMATGAVIAAALGCATPTRAADTPPPPQQTPRIPNKSGVGDASAQPANEQNEYSLRATTGEAIHPRPQERVRSIQPAPSWVQMKLLYTDQVPTGLQDVVDAWTMTKPEYYPGAGHGAAVLYQVYTTPDIRVTVMIGLSPKCRAPLSTQVKGSRVTSCPVNTFVQSRDSRPRLSEYRMGCFQWNGQAAPGSPTDPRLNSDYTLFDDVKQTLTVTAIKNGEPWGHCEVVLDLSPPRLDGEGQ